MAAMKRRNSDISNNQEPFSQKRSKSKSSNGSAKMAVENLRGAAEVMYELRTLQDLPYLRKLYKRYRCKIARCNNPSNLCMHHKGRHWQLDGDILKRWDHAIIAGRATTRAIPAKLLYLSVLVDDLAEPLTASPPQRSSPVVSFAIPGTPTLWQERRSPSSSSSPEITGCRTPFVSKIAAGFEMQSISSSEELNRGSRSFEEWLNTDNAQVIHCIIDEYCSEFTEETYIVEWMSYTTWKFAMLMGCPENARRRWTDQIAAYVKRE